MKYERALGILIGLATATVGWRGVVGRQAADGHSFALFAGLLAFLAIPAAATICILLLRRRHPDEGAAARQRRALTVVLWSAPVYGAMSTLRMALGSISPVAILLVAAFLVSTTVMILVGTISVSIIVRALARSWNLPATSSVPVPRGPSPLMMFGVASGGVLAAFLLVAATNVLQPHASIVWTQEKIDTTFPPGSRFPDLRLRRLDGSSVRLADFGGRAVLVNFWRTWCGPCVAEMPELDALEKSGEAVVLGVSSEPAELQGTFRRERKIEHELLVCDEKESDVRVGGFPTSVLVGPDGTVIASWVGAIQAEQVRAKLRPSTRAEINAMGRVTPRPSVATGSSLHPRPDGRGA